MENKFNNTVIIVTDNSQDYIQDLLWTILELLHEDTKLVIVDNLSNDETVPYIVGILGYNFVDYEDQFKFYIANKKKNKKELELIGRKVAEGKTIVCNVKGRLRKDYLEKRLYKGVAK